MRWVGAIIFYVTLLEVLFILNNRSPRWSSGYPRMLLALVLKFDSHRGEILIIFAKKQKKKEVNC